ncbi:menaquinone-dependent protoporphyrinogen IX dehydrogenase [Actinobacillus delphinicola]|uniref:Protoporphyrinogen IX dehydrogenase [quinone] n=1 Tax=Actinobacillus delphinicola TaxID=51161 RepID=A0A448TSQ1_9PAST|nr:menaquinone-dependent protoporphyrinogen IX dehydrogenase [Actinobacillus delphinicola]VEJ08853.1 protoporphyrinogen oxidase [Actinobacillus delphinicola]
MKILILYSTQDGQTQKIAYYLAEHLAPCQVENMNEFRGSLADFDVVIIGAPIRYGHFHPSLFRFIKGHRAILSYKETAFFGVNLTARKADKRTPETNPYMRKYLAGIAPIWQPKLKAVFAGALRYPRYKLIDRYMIKLIMKLTGGETDTSKEVEYTDWQQVDQFIVEIKEKFLQKN